MANAAKHSGAGRIDISVGRSDGMLEVEIHDDGSGGADAAGSGLAGLRRRVEALDGTLTVQSPRGRADDDPGGAAVRIVIAEDLALLRDGLARLLRDNDFDVVAEVADADALVHAVLRERPDLAIVDIRLPPTFRDEGLRAALELRGSAPETAILVLSQYVEHTYAAELLAQAGAPAASATCSRTGCWTLPTSSRRSGASPTAAPPSIPRSSRSCSGTAAPTGSTCSLRASSRC